MLPPWRLALVLHVSMDVFEQGHQFLFEDIIIVWATEPSGRAKVFELDPALRALCAVEGFQIVRFACHFNRLWLRQLLRTYQSRFVQVLLGTLLTEV
jgi:hypothetical protein